LNPSSFSCSRYRRNSAPSVSARSLLARSASRCSSLGSSLVLEKASFLLLQLFRPQLRPGLHGLAGTSYPQPRHPVPHQPVHRPFDLVLLLLERRSLVRLARLIANHIRLLHGLLAIARDHFFSCCPDALVELLLQVLGILVELHFSTTDVRFSCG